jgi:Arc/MetJ-type ribon-helix-helix transcriptional regulator
VHKHRAAASAEVLANGRIPAELRELFEHYCQTDAAGASKKWTQVLALLAEVSAGQLVQTVTRALAHGIDDPAAIAMLVRQGIDPAKYVSDSHKLVVPRLHTLGHRSARRDLHKRKDSPSLVGSLTRPRLRRFASFALLSNNALQYDATVQARLQVHLDPDRYKALRLLAAASDASVSDLVRQAIDLLLRSEFARKDWSGEMRAVLQRLQADKPVIVGTIPAEVEADAQLVKRRRKRTAT